jgi:hypothetical protein
MSPYDDRERQGCGITPAALDEFQTGAPETSHSDSVANFQQAANNRSGADALHAITSASALRTIPQTA